MIYELLQRIRIGDVDDNLLTSLTKPKQKTYEDFLGIKPTKLYPKKERN